MRPESWDPAARPPLGKKRQIRGLALTLEDSAGTSIFWIAGRRW